MTTAGSQESIGEIDEWTKPPFLRRVRIQGYKSIAHCNVRLQPLTILVGRNGAGKSNFLDALAFLRDGARFGVGEALKRRGGMSAVLHRAAKLDAFSIEVEAGFQASPPLDVKVPAPLQPWNYEVLYRVTIPVKGSTFGEPQESLQVSAASTDWKIGLEATHHKPAESTGAAGTGELIRLAYPRDQLAFSILGSAPYVQFTDGLRLMEFYNFHPEAIRALHRPNPNMPLEKDGHNLASVIATLKEVDPKSLERAQDYLSAIVEEIDHFDAIRYGEYETIRFRLRSGSAGAPVEFDAASMSDGTLRVLAAIMASFQTVPPLSYPSVIGIEEPETALHPAAAAALVDALDEATAHTQVLVTTHSADLLQDRDVHPSQILVARSRHGQTQIAPVDPASREIIHRELYTLSDLQRMNQLEPDEEDLRRQRTALANGEG